MPMDASTDAITGIFVMCWPPLFITTRTRTIKNIFFFGKRKKGKWKLAPDLIWYNNIAIIKGLTTCTQNKGYIPSLRGVAFCTIRMHYKSAEGYAWVRKLQGKRITYRSTQRNPVTSSRKSMKQWLRTFWEVREPAHAKEQIYRAHSDMLHKIKQMQTDTLKKTLHWNSISFFPFPPVTSHKSCNNFFIQHMLYICQHGIFCIEWVSVVSHYCPLTKTKWRHQLILGISEVLLQFWKVKNEVIELKKIFFGFVLLGGTTLALYVHKSAPRMQFLT